MVEIRGGGQLDGAQLIDAASDSTLRELITILQMQGRQAQANQVDQTAKQVKAADVDALTESQKKQTKQLDDSHDIAKRFKDNLDSMAKSLGTASATLASRGISSLFDFFNTGMDSFRQLSTIGTGFQGDLTSLATTALKAGQDLEHFTKLVMDNSSSLTALGGNAEGGARKLSEVSKALSDSALSSRLSAMGMTLKDTNDVLTAYLDTQSRNGTLSRQNAREIAENSVKFAENLDNMSRAFGISREQLLGEAKKLSLDPVINAMNMQIKNTEQRDRAVANQAAVLAIGGDQLNKAFQEIATGAIKSDLARGLVSLGTSTQQTVRAIMNGSMGMDEGLKRLNSGLDRSRSTLENGATLSVNELVQVTARARLDMQKYLNENQNQEAVSNDARRQALDKLGTTVGDFQKSLYAGYQQIKLAFVDTDVFRMIEPAMNRFIKVLNSGGLGEELLGLGRDLANAFGEVLAAMRQGWKDGGFWGAITNSITALFEKVGPVLESHLGSVLNKVFPNSGFGADKVSNTVKEVRQDYTNQKAGWQKTFDSVISYIQTKGEELFTALPESLKSGVRSAQSTISDLFRMVDGWMDNLPKNLEGLGGKISKSIGEINLTSITEKLEVIRESVNSNIGQISFDSIQNKIKDIKKTINDSINEISFASIESKIEGLRKNINSNIDQISFENFKTKIAGIGDTVRAEFTKIADIFKPGDVGPTAISNFSQALGQFNNSIVSIVENLSGARGSANQQMTASVVTGVLGAITNLIRETTAGIQSLQNLDPEKIQKLIPAVSSIVREVNSIYANMGMLETGRNAINGISTGLSGLGVTAIAGALRDIQNINFDKAKADENIAGARYIFTQLGELGSSSIWTSIQRYFNADSTSSVNKISQILSTFTTVSLNQEKANEIVAAAKTIFIQLGELGSSNIWTGIQRYFNADSTSSINKVSQMLSTFTSISLNQEKANEIIAGVRYIFTQLGELGSSSIWTGIQRYFNADFTSSISKVSQMLSTFTSINFDKTKADENIAGARYIFTQLGELGSSSVWTNIQRYFNADSTSSINKVSQMLSTFTSISLNQEKANEIVAAARTIFSGINGLQLNDQSFLLNTDQVNLAVTNIQKFQNINAETINGAVTSIGQLKGLGNVLGSDIQGVSTFTQSVSTLRSELEAGASAAERLKAAAGSIPNGIGGLAGANNAGTTQNDLYTILQRIEGTMLSSVSLLTTISQNTAQPVPPVTR
jgi:hypothetical protein